MTGLGKGKLHKIWFWMGLACVAVMLVPYLLLGQEAIVTYHDQLDGEMISYILQAKHLFDGSTLPEFLNGADKTALTMPAPGFVLLFLTGNYFAALVTMQLAGSVCGYVGMYLLSKEITGVSPIAAAVGVMFAYLPFLPVYGLSQYGIPLLVWCFLQLQRERHRRLSFVYIAVYALCSSLVLAGFGVLLLGIVWACLLWRSGCRRKSSGTGIFGRTAPGGIKSIMGGLAMLCIIYIVENFRLLGQILGGAGNAVSHKTEYVLTAEPFRNGLIQGFLQGGQHSEDYHKWILAGAVLVTVTALLGRAWKRTEVRRLLVVTGICAALNSLLALAAALWNSGVGIALRTKLQALGAFQVQRLLWLAPCFWYLMLACVLALAGKMLWHSMKRRAAEKNLAEKSAARRKADAALIVGSISFICCGLAAAVTGVCVLVNSNLKPNIQKLRNPDYGLLGYGDYYAVGVMEQVEDFLREATGEEPENYRVVSLGIDPAAALYQGFYCLDGYSNNYSLAYKHSFRSIIAPELAKSDYLQEYFDDWGNRCYLVSAECPGYYTIEKNGFYFQDYSLDTKVLKELGGKYLFSAAYIMNASQQGLVLLREEPFETEESYYRIFVYEIL